MAEISRLPAAKLSPPIRPEFERTPPRVSDAGEIERPLSLWEHLANMEGVRRGAIVLALMVAWQLYAVWLSNPLMFPTLTDTLSALWDGLIHGVLLQRIGATLQVLMTGYVIGIALAAVLTTFAVSSRLGADLLATLTAMFNPLPAIALLPLALLWLSASWWKDCSSAPSRPAPSAAGA